MKYFYTLLSFLFYCPFVVGQTEVQQKSYSTEFGRFDIWIQGNHVSGSYEIAPKQVIGSIWAQLEGLTATGRWHDPHGKGDIIIILKRVWSNSGQITKMTKNLISGTKINDMEHWYLKRMKTNLHAQVPHTI